VEFAKYPGAAYSPGPGTSLTTGFILYCDPNPFLVLPLKSLKKQL